MTAEPSSKSKAWGLFDHIVAEAAPDSTHSNPWVTGEDGQLRFAPDYATLERLLGVPLYLKAGTQSGPLRAQVADRITKASSIAGVTASSAAILGKNYLKQVDVIMTDWVTGPELLISTKRMDSSYGKNAPNRVEESYGDAKNLRLRHPLAALGFAFGLRSDILQKEPRTAEWLFDLLAKLGQEDDAYHATCLVLMDYADESALSDTQLEEPNGILEPGLDPEPSEVMVAEDIPDSAADAIFASLPKVTVLTDRTPPILSPDRFLAAMVIRVLAATPVNMHEEARQRRAAIRPA